ncbi:MAG: ABC transporter ATP-binding protein [Bryobacterales bacterium]|nr:ABC transporter ATP-binding protein [Bryobacterales bacterium]MBV9400592.1 ABC transporter ATP-binding protein [Bryobacterales bacterium]
MIKGLNFAELLKPHSKALAIGFVAVIGEGVANLLEPWPLKVVLDNVLRSKALPAPPQNFVLTYIGDDKLAILKFAVLAVLAIAVIGAICSYTEKYVTTSVSQWVMHELRRILYSHIQRLSLSYHDHTRTGDLISRVTSDIDAIQSFIASGMLGVFINGLTLVGMVGVMLYLNWRFTLIALSVAPVLFLVVYSYTRRIKKASREVRKKEGEIVSVIQEVLSSIRVVKAFAREEYEQRRLEEESLEGIEIALRARSLKAKLAPIVEIIVAVGTCLVLWFGARMSMGNGLSAGALVVFVLYLGKMYKPMQELSKMTDTYSKASVGFERIREVLNTDGEIRDLPSARRAGSLKGRIEFARVNFQYQEDCPILKNVDLKIEPGQLAALVGRTGAGKSTIISLIPRFYDPASGVVKIDGSDIRSFTQRSLRQHIGFVLQETLLFHGTVWNNIAYGKPEATRAEILRAAELANAKEFIDRLPQGYDTIVGERGVTLSGGQRQRIAIARAIIRDAPILILDEPSTGLDAESEKLVFEALDRLMEGRTSIVIAHRLSTIQRANIIFVIDKGEIIERGTHDQLVQAGGLYAELYELQVQPSLISAA